MFRREVSAATPWYNNDASADNLNLEVVQEFILTTHEAYRKEVGEEFGKTVPGIFTDEPNILHAKVASGSRYLPWADCFSDYSQARRGYDLRVKSHINVTVADD